MKGLNIYEAIDLFVMESFICKKKIKREEFFDVMEEVIPWRYALI